MKTYNGVETLRTVLTIDGLGDRRGVQRYGFEVWARHPEGFRRGLLRVRSEWRSPQSHERLLDSSSVTTRDDSPDRWKMEVM